MKHIILLAAILLAACSSSTEVESHTPRLGQYTYTSTIAGSGTLTITYASADSIAGTWDTHRVGSEVRLTGAGELGFWNQDAYVLYGLSRVTINNVEYTTRYAHRITPTGSGVTCTVQILLEPQTKQACTLVHVGP